jgi:hypothetical protein
MKLSQKQTEAYKLALSGTKRVILYGGAIRGGKSYWLLLTFISLCSKYPKSRWCVVRESLPTLKRTLIVSLQQIIEQGLQPHIKEFNRDTFTLTFKNGSQIIFMAESFDEDKELNRFRGLEINGGGFDELNECNQATFYKMIERAGTWNHAIGNAPILVLSTCNPTHEWVKEVWYDRWVDNTLPQTWEYIPAKITDNPYVSSEYLESLKENMPEDEYRKFVNGDWNVVKIVNPFFYAYDKQRHTSAEAVFNPNRQIFISVDFNLNPFSVIFAHIWRDNKMHCHIFDEMSIENGSIGSLCDHIQSKYGKYKYAFNITGDAMGKRGDITQRDNASLYLQIERQLNLSGRQFKLPSNPTHENSRAMSNFILHNLDDFKINPNCKETETDMRIVQCDAYGTIIKKNRKDISERADKADCVRYLFNTFLYDWYMQNNFYFKK